MNSETKVCQNCKSQFTIEPEDFDFYKKIDVPPPTFCSNCRMQRRFAYRNERSLHRRKCEKTGKDILSCFAADSGVHVYDRDFWWSDNWDAIEYGRDYDFSKPFFLQFQELIKTVPMPALFYGEAVNTTYSNHVGQTKDVYLSSACWRSENVAYSSRCNGSKDCFDVFAIGDSEICYEDIASSKLYTTFFSENSDSCTDSYFLYDCRGCSNCFASSGLRNKQYHIFNQPYSKEEYFKKIKEFNLGSYNDLEAIKKRFISEAKGKAIRRFANLVNTQNVTGNNLEHTANCFHAFDLWNNNKDCKFVMNGGWNMTDTYDGYGVGEHAELMYELVDSGVQASRLLFGVVLWTGNNVQYAINCHNTNNLFGCIGLRSKSHCILNKQYSETEFKEMMPKIIAHMNEMPYVDKKGREYRYGEFFPIEISPFAYNETIANNYFPLTPESAEEKGFAWREVEKPKREPTIQAKDLPDHINEASDNLVDEIIGCLTCSRPFRIIQKELDFLKRYVLPLPRECPECRHLRRFRVVNLPFLYHRHCMCNQATHSHHISSKCPNEFETTYNPNGKEVVYCEQCYQAEVV
ncbi:MAG: hypothetical protein AAB691_00715 [Patescibacteria group bacterium]